MNWHRQLNRFTSTLVSALIIFSLVPLPAPAAGNAYYVAKNGSDANPGTLAQPFSTIQKAVNVAGAGDLIQVKAGTYNERVTLAKNGGPGNEIKLSAYQGDTVVVAKGFSFNGNYNVVSDFEITPGSNAAADIDAQIHFAGDHNALRNIYLHDENNLAGSHLGMLFDGNYNTADNVRVWKHSGFYFSKKAGASYNVLKNSSLGFTKNLIGVLGGSHNTLDNVDMHDPGQVYGGGNASDGLNIVGTGHTMKNSRLYNIFKIESSQHTDGLQWWSGVSDLTFDNNIFGSFATGGPLNMDDAGADTMVEGYSARVVWRNNIFLGRMNYVFHIKNSVGTEMPGWEFTNNVFRTSARIRNVTDASYTDWVIKNNIFHWSGVDYYDGASFDVDHNIYVGGTKSSWDGPNSLEVADIKYVNGDVGAATDYGLNADFRLLPGSPAIDAGTSDGASTTDKDGLSRYDDPNTVNTGGGAYRYYDIGAHEYNGGNEPPGDTTAPQISNVGVSDITQVSAQVSWATDEAADSQVEYGTGTNYGSSTAVAGSYVTNHTQALAGLAPSTTYHYRVKSRDAASNLAVSGDRTFTTQAPPTPGEPEYIWREAEDGALSAPMTASDDALASGGQHVYSPTADSAAVASYSFSTAQPGNYTVWGRVIAPNTANDSFLASLDSAADDVWDVLVGEHDSAFKWDRLNLRGSGTVDAPEFDPKSFYLAAGSHNLQIKAREPNTIIDRIMITNDPDYVPTGTDGSGGGTEPQDTTAPTTVMGTAPAAPDGANGWFATAPAISLTRDEPGITYYQWDTTGGAWQVHAGDIVAPEGAHTLYYYSVDSAGNQEAPDKSAAFKVDSASPTGSVTINADAPNTNSTAVSLGLSAADSVSGVTDMRFKNDDGAWSQWFSYATSKNWIMSAANGTKRVDAQFKDATGQLSAIVSDDIILDDIAPAGTVVTPLSPFQTAASFPVAWSGSYEAGSGVASYDIQYRYDNGIWQNGLQGVDRTSSTFNSPNGDGAYDFRARATDEAGNVETYSAAPSATTIVDTQAPTDPTLTSATHKVGESSEQHVIEVGWTGAADNGSGVDGYSIDWSSDGISLPDKTKDLEQGANGAVSPELADGTWHFNLRTVDNAGNWTSTVHVGPFEIVTPEPPADAEPPTGTVSIEGGAAYTASADVKLNLSADDGTGSGVTQMRLSNDGVFNDTAGLEGWRPYTDTADSMLAGGDGQKRVHAQFKDAEDNESAVYSDTIGLDRTDPVVTLTAPSYSTVQSKTTTFKINWTGADPAPASGIDSYTVRYRPANSSTWIDWKVGTKDTSADFAGTAGRSYYFRVKAYDKAGNIGWSTVKRTIVPYNEGSLIRWIRGFGGKYANPDSNFYLGSVRYSMKKNDRIVYKFDGDHIALISTRANSRGKAKIYIDGSYVKTIDTYSTDTQHHKVVFSHNFEKRGIHYIKIRNLGTPGHSRFDIDGLAVGR